MQGFKPDYPASYTYSEVLDLSLLFYEAQRSGPLPADNRVDWRGDSAMDDAVTGGDYIEITANNEKILSRVL